MVQVYSDWMRIDLHIHTDLSRKTKNGDYKGNFNVDVLHQKLKEEQVSIFSMTDHNIINIEAYKKYYEMYNRDTDPLLLTGVELDIEGSNTTYHSLLIFNCTDYIGAKLIHDSLEEKYIELGCGDFDRKLTFDDIITVFENRDFFFIPHAGNTSSITRGYKDNIAAAQKMIILLQSPMEKVPEKSRQIYNEHFDERLTEAFRNKEDFAYIEFSDNHFIENYPCRHMGDQGNHEFYYVKGSKSYETLRLAFIDPKSRIKSPYEYAVIQAPRDYLKSLSITENNLICGTDLSFSPHLNVIIGGRSSGKSLLMNILNRSIDTLECEKKYDGAIEGAEIRISSNYEATPGIKSHINTEILQINQGDIVNYFEDNDLSSLAKKAGKLEVYQEARKKFEDIKSKLQENLYALSDRYEELHALDVNQGIILHNQTIQQLLNLEYHLKIDTDVLNTRVFRDDQFEEAIKLLQEIESRVQKIEKAATIQISEDDKQIIENFYELISRLQKQQSALKLEHTYKRQFVDAATKDVELANSRLNKEGQGKAFAEKTRQMLNKQVKSHFQGFTKLLKLTDKIRGTSFSHIEEIKLDDDSLLCIELNCERDMEKALLEGIKDNTEDDLYQSMIDLLYRKASLKNYKDIEPASFKKKTTSQFSGFARCFDELNDFLKYKDGTTSKSNSPGFNSEKYLQVVLNNPKCGLIIIDQPEDNLGNKFIAEELVEMIRRIKFNKQLFLITHNPAIVVYGDAESIIIAENNDNKISYSQVKLEDVAAQKRICATLDGGEYIFDNRSRKYNIQKLLQEVNDGSIEA